MYQHGSLEVFPTCSVGACHMFYMLELTRDLEQKSQDIVHKVLQNNSYFCHPENIIVSCLADPSKEVRSHGVHYILEARKNINPQHQPCQFLPPKINFAAKSYTDMIDWSKEQKMEPPLTIQMTENEILESLEKLLKLPSYPCHTQDVERLVPCCRIMHPEGWLCCKTSLDPINHGKQESGSQI